MQYFLLNGHTLPETASLELRTQYTYEKPMNLVRGMNSQLNVQSTYNQNVRVDVSGSGFYSSYFSHLRVGDIVTIAPSEPIRCKAGTQHTWVGSRAVTMLTGSGKVTAVTFQMQTRGNTVMYAYEWDFYYPTSKPDLQESYSVFFPLIECVVLENGAGMDRSGSSFNITFLSTDSAQLEWTT